MKRLLFKNLWFLPVSLVLLITCQSPSPKDEIKYEVIHQKKFGNTDIIMCLVNDTDAIALTDIAKKLTEDNKSAYVFFYTSIEKIENDESTEKDILDAMPATGFAAVYSYENGLLMGGDKDSIKIQENAPNP